MVNYFKGQGHLKSAKARRISTPVQFQCYPKQGNVRVMFALVNGGEFGILGKQPHANHSFLWSKSGQLAKFKWQ